MNRGWDLYMPQLRLLVLVMVLMGICLLPFAVFDAVKHALAKLHLSPFAATATMVGIFLGSMINLPLFRLQRDEDQAYPTDLYDRQLGWVPLAGNSRQQTILAVNVGGCIIPLMLAFYQLPLVLHEAAHVRFALVASSALTIFVCYRSARSVPGIGIALPAFLPPLVAVVSSWILLGPDEYNHVRASVAFIAGILGPLVGGDLLHLRRFGQVSAGLISIGGAGTFDGIVVSGLLAAFLA